MVWSNPGRDGQRPDSEGDVAGAGFHCGFAHGADHPAGADAAAALVPVVLDNQQLRPTIAPNERVPVPIRWGETLGDDVVAAATIDRLVHHAHVIALDGDSYRTRKHRTGPPPAADTTK